MIYANGDRYEGAFKADMRHGHGVMKFANESVYEGDFYQNEMHGYGKYKSHLGGNLFHEITILKYYYYVMFVTRRIRGRISAQLQTRLRQVSLP